MDSKPPVDPKPQEAPVYETAGLTTSQHTVQALRDGKNKRVRKLLVRMHPGKIAAFCEAVRAAMAK